MKERLTKLIKEAQERYIYAEEQAQYLIDNGVECVKHGEWISHEGYEECGECQTNKCWIVPETGLCSSKEEATEKWNTRTPKERGGNDGKVY